MTDAPARRWPFGKEQHPSIDQAVAFMDMVPSAMALMDVDGRVVHANGSLCDLLRSDPDLIIGQRSSDLLAPADRRYALARAREEWGQAMSGPVGEIETMTALRGDGSSVPVAVTMCRLVGRYDGLMLSVVRDASGDVEAESHASETARLYGMLAAANAGVLRARTRAEVYAELCRVATEVGDFRMAWVAVAGADGVLVPVAASGPALAPAIEDGSEVRAPIAELALRRRELVVVHDIATDPLTSIHAETSLRSNTRSGCAIPILCRGDVVGVFSTYMEKLGGYDHRRLDLLEQLVANVSVALESIEDRNRHLELAFSDPLTGLPNRARLFERLQEAAESAGPDRGIAVLLVDLDGFKDVNDALGHDIGDQLLMAVANRLVGAIRSSDFVARLGGDEFAVLCTDVADSRTPVAVAEAISRSLEEPFQLEGIQAAVRSSIGITVRQSVSTDVRALLREADAALYVAKESGRDRWELYDDEMRRRALERLELSSALRFAADAGQLRVVWQPVVPLHRPDTVTRTVIERDLRHSWVSLEALVRWEHPTLGAIPPDRFIPLAEEIGLIIPIGNWILAQALDQLARWTAVDPACAPDVIAVNLSARQLSDRGLVPFVAAALDQRGIDPRRVAFEVTETAALTDPATTHRTLSSLREMGMHIAIDDFGTGYSSLAHLRDLPFDALKIDRSFVARLGGGGADDEIVRTMVSLGHGFDLVVIGEGVETAEQRDVLAAMGCDRGQGYLWARPLEAEAVPGWIREHRHLH